MNKISFLNIQICSITKTELLQQMHSGILITPNVDHVVKLQKDKEFLKCYQKADWVICDSNILNLAAKFWGRGFKEVIPGSSLLPEFYNYHRENKAIKIFLLGSASGVADTAMKNINKNVGWEMVIGAHSPSYGFEKNEDECQEIVDIINKSGANVLVVGVGAPKQEKWIVKYEKSMPNVNLFMALGATIDFEAGKIKRAPALMRKLHLEWLFRLLKEPKRLWKRYLLESLPFFVLIFRQKLNIYEDPFINKIYQHE